MAHALPAESSSPPLVSAASVRRELRDSWRPSLNGLRGGVVEFAVEVGDEFFRLGQGMSFLLRLAFAWALQGRPATARADEQLKQFIDPRRLFLIHIDVILRASASSRARLNNDFPPFVVKPMTRDFRVVHVLRTCSARQQRCRSFSVRSLAPTAASSAVHAILVCPLAVEHQLPAGRGPSGGVANVPRYRRFALSGCRTFRARLFATRARSELGLDDTLRPIKREDSAADLS